MKHKFLKVFIIWLPFAAVITFACGLSYLLVQQDLRMNANDPQVSIAQDVSHDIAEGAAPTDIVPPGQTEDMSTSLDPYVIIYSASGTVLASAATLDGQTPSLPNGVLTDAQEHGMDKITWQPAPGVRSAIVVEAVPAPGSGFVLAGRSISEVEANEGHIMNLVDWSWLAGLIVMFAVIWILVAIHKKRNWE